MIIQKDHHVEWLENAKTHILPKEGYGTFSLRPFDLATDIDFLHEWVNLPYAKYWQLENSTKEKVKEVYEEIVNETSTIVFIGQFDNEPAFLVEYYKAQEDRIGEYYPAQEGDFGFHILVGPSDTPKKGFTTSVFKMVMDFLFQQDQVTRIVVEPDVDNDKIHVLNKRAGFQYDKVITLPEKKAHLAFCTREDYQL
ncbi:MULTISPECIES: GNAT family N-acetyltransferase [Flammeovirga]|uniref:Acetyltransferase n=1 Tax=Flammeovirga agarivorans TaxID=2726742 RepID=A0A7X8SGL2_9BACT|nr:MULTISPECIES: GNAT family N-acetyltransferase [Flammeovirga]NLR89848.1 acetyltransferase [Flammeovirga agarivorans]